MTLRPYLWYYLTRPAMRLLERVAGYRSAVYWVERYRGVRLNGEPVHCRRFSVRHGWVDEIGGGRRFGAVTAERR